MKIMTASQMSSVREKKDRSAPVAFLLSAQFPLVTVHGCRFTVSGFFQGTYVILEAFGCWFQLLIFLFQIQPSREKPMTSFNMLFFQTVNRQLQTVNGFRIDRVGRLPSFDIRHSFFREPSGMHSHAGAWERGKPDTWFLNKSIETKLFNRKPVTVNRERFPLHL